MAYCAILTVCSFYGIVLSNYFLIAVSVYFFVYCIFSHQYLLIVSSIFIIMMCFTSYFIQQPPEVDESRNYEGSLVIYPDSVMINGDQLMADGRLDSHLIRLKITLKSKEEKQKWLTSAQKYSTLKVIGHFQAIDTNDNQHAFDYQRYLQDKNYMGQFEILKYRQEKGSHLQLILSELRYCCIRQVDQTLSKKASQYVQALVFGYKNRDFQEVQSLYSLSGVLHLFTISGTHVVFFLGLFDFLMRRLHLSFHQRILPLCIGSISAMFFFGISMSVLRATLTYLISYILGRTTINISRLDRFSLVLIFLMIIFPNTLLVLSGQLSLFVSFLLIFIPKKKNKFKQMMWMQYLSLLSAPFLLSVFYQWPIFGGILTYLFTIIFSCCLLPFCLLLFLFTFVPPILLPFNIIFDFIVGMIEYLLQFTIQFNLTIGWIPTWFALLCIIIGILVIQTKYHYLLPIICIICPFLYVQMTHLSTRVTYVNVGQGASCVIQSPLNHEVSIIDTGGRVTFNNELWKKRRTQPNCQYSLVPYLKGEGISKIDSLFISYGDTDHMGDVVSICTQFRVKRIFMTKGAHNNPKIARQIAKIPKRTQIYEVLANQVIGQKIPLHVLYPNRSGKAENKDSMVLYTKINQISLLWTGDLPKEGELEILRNYPQLKVDIIQVGHHGSHTSTSEAFIREIKPKIAIISVGKKNRYGHPHRETLTTLKKYHVSIRRTDINGMIQYRLSHFHNIYEFDGK